MKTIKADLTNEGRFDILDRVRPYRGGNLLSMLMATNVWFLTVHIRIFTRGILAHVLYMPCHRSLLQDRRRIEQDAFSGALLGIVATNALELGIDIGALDAVIMLGFPMTISNFVRFFLSCHVCLFKRPRRDSSRGEQGVDLVILFLYWLQTHSLSISTTSLIPKNCSTAKSTIS